MYQVIARKYRPQSFAELIGQEHVKTTLENAITQNRIAHGYILSGQRGTGKTTVARILARCLNCINGPTTTPCGECASCREIAAGGSVDVIEIDAASNRGINEMRELRENVRYRPARDRYKVFVVDEAHQITTDAFNALLKTLEEPPEWAVFILCTTESHKIPTTIASRCQQFSFRSVEFQELIGRLEWILKQEGITADPETLAVLALAGEGSVRDSLSALDQAIACCGTTLDATEVRRLLGMFSLDSLEKVTAAIGASDSRRMLEVVDELERNGRHLQHFSRELSRYFRNLLVSKIAGESTRLIAASGQEQQRIAQIGASFSEEDLTRYLQIALDIYKDLQASLQPRLHLEIGLLRLIHASRLMPIEEALAMTGAPTKASGPPPPPPASPTPAPRRATGPSPFATDSARKTSSSPTPAADMRSRLHASLVELGMTFTADAVEHSTISENGSELVITTPEDFRLAMKPTDLEKAAQAATGRPWRIKVNIGETAPQAPVAAAREEDEIARRALAHPEVQKFQELFPGSQVRTVRNLKE
jgi:DNA polymerase III subunit gamma/tau